MPYYASRCTADVAYVRGNEQNMASVIVFLQDCGNVCRSDRRVPNDDRVSEIRTEAPGEGAAQLHLVHRQRVLQGLRVRVDRPELHALRGQVRESFTEISTMLIRQVLRVRGGLQLHFVIRQVLYDESENSKVTESRGSVTR